MIAQLSRTRADQVSIERNASRADVRWYFFLGLVSVMSLAVCAWFNFGYAHPNVSFVGDAGVYLEEARRVEGLFNVYDIVNEHKISKLSPTELIYIAESCCRMPDFRANGPVFPFALFATYRLAGQHIGTIVNGWFISNYYIPVLAQCILAAANCAMLGLLGATLWNRRCGSIAAALAMLYPAFIVNSGRVTTETLSTTILILIALCTTCLIKSQTTVCHMLLGILLGVMQLTRSAMALLWMTIFPTVIAGTAKPRWKPVLLAFTGAAIILAPWLIWQKCRFGECSIIVDRAGKYNLVVGHDPQRAGWLSMPHPSPGWANTSSPARIVWRCFKENPEAWLSIQLDKPARLFKNTWNDFAQPIGPVSVAAQNMFHQWLLLMAAVGLILNFWTRRKEDLIPRLVLFEILATHAIYLLFTPVGRYNLTAMPFILVIAAAGIDSLITSSSSHEPGRKLKATWLAIVIVLCLIAMRAGAFAYNGAVAYPLAVLTPYVVPAVTLVLLIITAYIAWSLIPKTVQLPSRAICLLIATILIPLATLPLRAHGRPGESSTVLAKPTCRTIRLPQNRRGREYYLAVDASDGLSLTNEFSIFVNDHRVDGPWIPGIALSETGLPDEPLGLPYHYRQLMFHILAASSNTDVLGLRQWFFTPLGKDTIGENAVLNIRVERSAQGAKAGAVFSHIESGPQVIIPHLAAYSFDKAFYGVESDNGLSDPRLDQTVKIGKVNKPLVAPNVFIISPIADRHRKDTRSSVPVSVRLGDILLGGADRSRTVSLPRPPQLELEDILLVRIRGVVRSNGPVHPCALQAWTRLSNATDSSASEKFDEYLSYSTPSRIPATRKPFKFDIALPLSRSAFDDKIIRDVRLVFMRDSESIGHSTRPVTPQGKVCFENVSAEMSIIHENPSLSNKDIY